MQVYHILPAQDAQMHEKSSDCWCKPILRDPKDSGVSTCWQHNKTGGAPYPFMAHGLMSNASGWVLYVNDEPEPQPPGLAERVEEMLHATYPPSPGQAVMVFPVLEKADGLRAFRLSLLYSEEAIKEIEARPCFRAWARDPRTGQINLEFDSAGLKEAVQSWVDGMKPMQMG